MNLAPIGISTYSRTKHLKQTIQALQKNTLAKESELYIFSDAPKKGDEDIVGRVREYADSVTGFKKVHVVKRKSNGRVKNNRGGMKQLLDSHGKCIFMEDDIVTAPGFLQFINDGLEFYKNDKKVRFVGGHTPNLKTNLGNNEDVYFSKRFHGWGFGIWQNSFYILEQQVSLKELINNKNIKDALDENGTDLYNMVVADAKGDINASDVRVCYQMAIKDLYIALPTKTLVKNIGLDGSGVHCGNDDIYADDKLSKKTSFNFCRFYYDKKIHNEYKKFYKKPAIVVRVINKLSRIIFGRNLIK